MPLPTKIQVYVDDNILTLEEATALTPAQRQNLRTEGVRRLIVNGQLTSESAIQIRRIS